MDSLLTSGRCSACPTKSEDKMGQQHRKVTKRRRRHAYIKRRKEMIKNSNATTPILLAKKITVPTAETETVIIERPGDEAPAKKAAPKKTDAASAEKAPAKKPAAKKAPAKKPAAKKADADEKEA